MAEPKLISKNILENLVYLRSQFDECMDFMLREFKITGTDAAIIALDGLVNKQTIAQGIMNPILNAQILENNPEDKLKYIRDNALSTVDQALLFNFEDALDRMLSGFALLMMDGCDWVIAFGVQGFQFRGISEPNNEVMQRCSSSN